MRSDRLSMVCVWLGAALAPLSACGVTRDPGSPGGPGDLTCEAPTAACDGACVDVSTDTASCGRCGRDCGGGACAGGKCQPIVVADAADGLDEPAALAVNDDAIFWTERTRVRSCPLPLGCVLEPRLVADAYARLEAIGVTEDDVYFTGCRACDDHHDLRRCPVAGCPEPSPIVRFSLHRYDEILIGETRAYWREYTEAMIGCEHADCAGTDVRWGFMSFGGELAGSATDGDTVYVKPAGGDLRACDDADGCALPRVLPGSAAVEPPFRVHGGRAYWLANGPTTGQVRTCDLASCGAGSIFAADAYGGTELEIDDSGVYWINPAAGTLRHCPLDGCPPGGAAVLASGRAGAKALTLGPGFAYWIEGNAIYKLARP